MQGLSEFYSTGTRCLGLYLASVDTACVRAPSLPHASQLVSSQILTFLPPLLFLTAVEVHTTHVFLSHAFLRVWRNSVSAFTSHAGTATPTSRTPGTLVHLTPCSFNTGSPALARPPRPLVPPSALRLYLVPHVSGIHSSCSFLSAQYPPAPSGLSCESGSPSSSRLDKTTRSGETEPCLFILPNPQTGGFFLLFRYYG